MRKGRYLDKLRLLKETVHFSKHLRLVVIYVYVMLKDRIVLDS